MKTVLAISFFPAFLPPRSGGEVRLFSLYNALSEDYNVVLLTSGYMGGTVETLRHNANFCEVRVPKGDEFGAKWAELQAHSGTGDLSAPCLAAISSDYSELHEQFLLHYGQADIIIHDSPFLAGYDLFLGFDKKPRIYNSYNVEFDVYSQLHKENGSDVIPEIVRDCEARLCRHAQLVTGCSPEDVERFRELYAYSGASCIVPNGIHGFDLPSVSATGNRLVFIGSAHLPNVLAAQTIAEQLAPALPDYEFHIMGRCMESAGSTDNLIVHGPVDDSVKRELFRSALASVNPMMEGGGSSLKIADLAASGVPVISTRMGVRGFDFRAGEHYVPLDQNDPVASLREVLHDRASLHRIANKAALHIQQKFTWRSIAAQMAEAIDAACVASDSAACFTVLNDYDPWETVGGGATRIKGLYEAVSKRAKVLILCFAHDQTLRRREEYDGRVLLLSVPKTETHRIAERDSNALHHISVVDILAIREAPANPQLSAIFQRAASFSDLVICEHPYMVGLVQKSGARFVYSSQNFELRLKRQLLEGHPMRAELLDDLCLAESYATGCAELVVAVSDEDATALGAAFALTAPIVVIPNGADEPAPITDDLPPLGGRNVVFLGSAHMPNIDAARFILDELAPRHPDVTFHIVGSACMALEKVNENVTFWGVVDDETKSEVLGRCHLALNPMTSGSGSNVKVADYLKNGLMVISTEFGARGYHDYTEKDILLASLDDFSRVMTAALSDGEIMAGNAARKKNFTGKLSMYSWGESYATLLHDKLIKRPRIAFMTYRYNAPFRGGAEAHLQRLIEELADAGHEVDVLTTSAVRIDDKERFASDYPKSKSLGEIPVGNPRIRCAKFPIDDPATVREGLTALWAQQPHFERELCLQFEPQPETSGLAWGWASGDTGGRWTYALFGVSSGAPGTMSVTGFSPRKCLLRITADGDKVLGEWTLEGDFEIAMAAPAGRLDGRVFALDEEVPADARPLGLYVRSIMSGGKELATTAPLTPWPMETDATDIYRAFHSAALGTRCEIETGLSDVRGPHSSILESYLAQNLRSYDLLVTHNAVFRTATRSVEMAKDAGVPSVLVPLVHFEDDYYHFPDVYEACRTADLTLASPKAACRFLEDVVGANVKYHTPGVDLAEAASEKDVADFQALYSHSEPFFLVVGRKSGAKQYRQVIDAVARLRESHAVRLVMIGVDEDRLPVSEVFVSYLGVVDRSVVRGAFACCTALVNMSGSESFGMVLVEAGQAGVPVLGNRYCAPFGDIITDGENGYLVSPETLAGKMAELLESPALVRRMGQAGLTNARQFDWRSIGATFVTDCEQLMQRAALQR